MDIQTLIAIIAAVGGLSGLFSAISTAIFKFLDYRKEKKGETLDAKIQPVLARFDAWEASTKEWRANQEENFRQIRLDTTRLQLSALIYREPDNIDSILKVAEFYFCELGGNWWMASEFKHWARQHDVDVPENIWNRLRKEKN